tara:strand:+ start:7372 stop:7536 length:165 start_codon:yes stop_codon:yes gene_type:complete
VNVPDLRSKVFSCEKEGKEMVLIKKAKKAERESLLIIVLTEFKQRQEISNKCEN